MTAKMLKKVEDILRFAISNEEASAELYASLGSRRHKPGVAEMFLRLAGEERVHKAKLEKILAGRALLKGGAKLAAGIDLEDYTVAGKPSDDMDLQEALLFAMKKEKAAFRFYLELAELASDPKTRELFEGLAREEAGHKLRFETEYDRLIQPDN